MNRWLNYHWQIIQRVLTRMYYNKLSTFMISLVIAVAICLPSLFYMGVNHLSKLSNHIQDETEISLFLKLDADADAILKIDAVLAKNDAIKQFHLVTRDQAWQDLKAKVEYSEIDNKINQLAKNPLPDAFFIQAKSTDPATLKALKEELQAIPSVEQAVLNTEWAKRLATLLALGTKIILCIAVLLALALLIIIGNTVRMQILMQKDEIIVSKLIGATSRFIRTPFLYSGMLYGGIGGLLAIVILTLIVQLYNQSVAELSHLYGSDFSLPWLNFPLFIWMIVASIFIGWLGSYLAVTRAIASIKIN